MIDPECTTAAKIVYGEGGTVIETGVEEVRKLDGVPLSTARIIRSGQYSTRTQPLTGGGLYVDVTIAPSSGRRLE